jgi:thermostable 8-oxoguanine DNA glycosylase
MYTCIDGHIAQLELPDVCDDVLPGVPWGAFDQVMTPAYWAGQAWQHSLLRTYEDLSLGRSLAEELAACLLGGYGMPAAVGLCAYERLRSLGLLAGTPHASQLENALSQPMLVGNRLWTYRFPRQKARYLAGCLAALPEVDQTLDDVSLRNKLTDLPGIGMKTASWIVRNIRRSNSVAIIDVHILRVCREMGVFAPELSPERDYIALENDFLIFAEALGTPAFSLDGLIWSYMRMDISKTSQLALFDSA